MKLRFKLSFKLFLVFLIINISSVSVLILANHYIAGWNFNAYIRFRTVQKLEILSGLLSQEYDRHSGWQWVVDTPEMWASFIRNNWPFDEFEDPNVYIVEESKSQTPAILLVNPNDESDSTPIQLTSYQIGNLSLFDSKKQLIAGNKYAFFEIEKAPIKDSSGIIGWVGVKFGPPVYHPIDHGFIKKQLVEFNIIGVIVLIVSAVVVFLFSKHLLAPIKQLSLAMKSLTDRCYNTRMPTERNDELGVLSKRFNTMAEQFFKYDQTQRQWLSDISHELRTPLSVLIGEIEAFQDDVLKLDKASLAALGDEAKYLRRIVEDLHFISLSETNSISMERRTIKPLMILSQTLYLFEKRIKKRNISIKVQFEQGAEDLELLGDQIRLKQVFSNLIENALQHMDNPGLLTVDQKCADDSLVISFTDSGPGVPNHALPHLFDRLYKADPSRNRKSGGSGIGLAICKAIITWHNGEITAQNTKNGGLSIEITLPLLNENLKEVVHDNNS